MLRVCLDDIELLQLLTSVAEDMARATVPEEAMQPFMLASMTALQKKNGGVRGIATGTSFRRLVAKALARQFGAQVGGSLLTIPIRPFHQGRHRLRWPRSTRSDGR